VSINLFSYLEQVFDVFKRYFKHILHVFSSPPFYTAYVALPTDSTPLSSIITSNLKFLPFFDDTLSAIDSTHIACTLAAEDQHATRNRKGFLLQNYLALCNFDLQFMYFLSGWERSASDSTIYNYVCITDLQIPPGKYYLANAGFPSCDELLTPYYKM
jgi:hypothetical protein